jgi:hypothetical protein
VASKPSLSGGFDLPFAEQIAFFRQKISLPTEHWDDIKKSAHDRMFVVAGAMKADLLNDLLSSIDKGIATGTGLETFRKDFRAIVGKHGWQGWTGEGSPGGFAWRTRVIFETNLRTSYAAGRWAQLTDPRLVRLLPYWQYVHDDSVMTPRPLHLHWGNIGLTLPWDHPFWQTHFPPNGWLCRCRVTAVAAPGKDNTTEPPAGWDTIDERTGEMVGIDKGWGYAPGANVTTPLLDIIGKKLINLDAPIGAAMWQALAPAVENEAQILAINTMIDRVLKTGRGTNSTALIGALSPDVVDAYAAKTGHELASADFWLRDTELLHALRETKTARGAALPVEIWRNLPQLLKTAEVYYDTTDPAVLVYVFNSGTGKVAIRVSYTLKTNATGQKRVEGNFIVSGGVVDPRSITASRSQYILLERGSSGGT